MLPSHPLLGIGLNSRGFVTVSRVMTTIVTVTEETVKQNLEQAQKGCKQLDRGLEQLVGLELFRQFGTIGFDGYTNWILNGRPDGLEMTG